MELVRRDDEQVTCCRAASCRIVAVRLVRVALLDFIIDINIYLSSTPETK
jgi:hypothetical protein